MRNQRDEPTHAAIADATATNLTDQKAAINAVIDALQSKGVVPAP